MTDSDRPMPPRLVELGFDAPMPPRQRQALLQENFPGWEIWYVPRALGGMTWCARRDPHDINPLHADRPSELAEAIEATIAEGSSDGDDSGGGACPDQSAASGVDDNAG